MNPKQTAPAPLVGITLHEALYILRRHKVRIVAVACLGVAVGLLVRFFVPLPYTSEAALMIHYVRDEKPPMAGGADAQVTSFTSREDNVINAELGILTSYDLATNVVGILTPTKIMAKQGGGTNRTEAARFVRNNLKAEVAPRSDLIELSFSHRNPEMATLILNQVIESYLKRHNEIHRPEFNDFLSRVTEDLKGKLRDSDKALLEAKKDAHVMELSESQRQIVATMAKIQQDIYDAQAEWAGLQQTIRELQYLVPKSAPTPGTNSASGPSGPGAEPKPVAPEKLAEYQRVCEKLRTLEGEQEKLLLTYTTNNSFVQTSQTLIDRQEEMKKDLETKFPGLLVMKPISSGLASPGAAAGADPEIELRDQMMKADNLQAKIHVWNAELAETRTNADAMTRMEGTLTELQRERDQQVSELEFYMKKLEENNTEEIFAENNSNISVLQSPTPASRDELKLTKWMVEIMLAGLAVAFGLPFLTELVLDRSLKHPAEVQAKLAPLPFFISIPRMHGNGSHHTLKEAKKRLLLPDAGEEEEAAPANGEKPAQPANGHLTLWQDRHGLQPFYETLRDRLMTFFEMINLTHKPKLVAVTSCGPGAGVTTTAAGLASSLSETGDGNVLLVNMNVRDGEAHHFYRGKLTCGLDEVLEKGTRDHAYVEGNLYVAKEQPEDDRLPRVLPKRFSHLLPKMKASDFDYIIFDMPPVSQISITPRLARFMDMVLLVVEARKTDRDAAKRVASLLSDSKTNVGIVLNKNEGGVSADSQEHDV